jgi:hypothetical protein
MPLVVTEVRQERMVELIVNNETLDPQIEELTAPIGRLREQLLNINVELVKA